MVTTQTKPKGVFVSKSTDFTITNQIRSKGGKAAAKSMTPQQRKERSIKAQMGKKCNQHIPKATHTGELTIGNVTVGCAVLDNGTRVITETSMFELLKRSRKGRKSKGTGLPAFLSPNNLKPFISNEIIKGLSTFEYFHPKRGKTTGIDATLIPQICKVYVDAQLAGVLTDSQLPSAYQALIITQALAQTGITALIDESSGYQEQRENNELQKLFNKFIAKELQPWTKRFPDTFFKHLKRMYGLEHLKGNPQFFGHLINRYIYDEISQEVREELCRKNPLNQSGNRQSRHHQYLTDNVGHPALDKQIVKVNTLLSISKDKEEFEELYNKTRKDV